MRLQSLHARNLIERMFNCLKRSSGIAAREEIAAILSGLPGALRRLSLAAYFCLRGIAFLASELGRMPLTEIWLRQQARMKPSPAIVESLSDFQSAPAPVEGNRRERSLIHFVGDGAMFFNLTEELGLARNESQKRLELFVQFQSELINGITQVHRHWWDRMQSEATLVFEFSARLAVASSMPETATAYRSWANRRMELVGEDVNYLLAEGQKIMAAGREQLLSSSLAASTYGR